MRDTMTSLLDFSIDQCLGIDLVTVVTCSVLLAWRGKIRHSHPGVIFLVYHLVVVTSRLAGLAAGAPTLFSEVPYTKAVTLEEMARAAVLSDVALVVMTCTWLWVARHYGPRRRPRGVARGRPRVPPMTLRPWIVRGVALSSFAIGIGGMVLFAKLPGLDAERGDLGPWSSTAWLSNTQTWPCLSLLALFYINGPRLWITVPFLACIGIGMYQGYHRFRVVIPLLLALHIYLDRRQWRWPSISLAAGMLAVFVLFFPLKHIGRLAQEGANPGETWSQAKEILTTATMGQAGDQMILDQLASGLTLIDRSGGSYFGKTYLALVTLPIPRPLWPSKPGLADHLADISIPERPMSTWGMVLTFLGDAYVNFGNTGLLFIPALFAYRLGRFHFAAYQRPYFSVMRFAYLLTAANLLQVYRDGLSSLVVFTTVAMMPLCIIVLLHRRIRGASQHPRAHRQGRKVTGHRTMTLALTSGEGAGQRGG
jgi:hypothetical protein